MSENIEPLRLADGTLVYPVEEVEEKQAFIEVPTHDDAIAEVTYRRRRLSELPETPSRLNLMSVILSYHLLGVNNHDIATVLEIPESRVEAILLTDAFIKLQQEIVNSILEKDAETIRTVFRQGAKKAANTVTSLLSSDNETVALSAAKDLLDRDGHRPADIVEHRHKVEGGLTINFIQKKDESKLLDGEFEVVKDG